MRKLFFLLITICGVTLTGCAQLTILDESQSNTLAEYMAGTVLKYDKNYDEALIYPAEDPETTETEETADSETAADPDKSGINNNNTLNQTTNSQTGNPGGAAVPAAYGDIQFGETVSLSGLFEEILQNNFKITFQDYKFFDSYPSDKNAFTIDPSKNMKLVSFIFNVKNITKKARKLDLKNYKISYQLTDNNGSAYYPLMTLLRNDIQYINLEVAAGKTQKAVILFEVPKNIDMSDMLLLLTYKDENTFLDINQ